MVVNRDAKDINNHDYRLDPPEESDDQNLKSFRREVLARHNQFRKFHGNHGSPPLILNKKVNPKV